MYSGWNPARYLYSLNRAVSGSASIALSRSAVTLSCVAGRASSGESSSEGRSASVGERYTERLSGDVSRATGVVAGTGWSPGSVPAATAEPVAPGVPRVAVEAGVTDGWWKYGCSAVVGLDRFGESAPAGVLFEHFGLTAERVVEAARGAIAASAAPAVTAA